MSDLILNLTTEEYFSYDNKETQTEIIKGLITPLKTSEAILKEDIGTSYWSKDDKIVYVPSHLRKYVIKRYNSITFLNSVKYNLFIRH